MLLFVSLALAEDFAITHATILPVSSPMISDGTVLIQNGKITAIGQPVLPPGIPILDAGGQFLMPGLIDIHSHMGVYPWPDGSGSGDGNELVEPFTPRVWAGDSFDPEDPAIDRAQAGGITTIQVLPGSGNLIGGRSVIVKLRELRTLGGMIFEGAPPGIKMAVGENPKRVYKDKTDDDQLMTRMGEFAAFRGIFQKAVEYRAIKAKGGPKDEDLEVLLDVLDGKIRVNLHCYRSLDILGFYRIADEFKFKVATLHHALEAYKVRDVVIAHGTGIGTWPDWWGFKQESWDGIPWGPTLFAQSGGTVALHSDSANTVQRMYVEAAKMVRYGMEEQEALKAITLNPATLLGVEARVGSIEVGKDADLALFSRHPLDTYTLVMKTWIDGKLIYDRSVEGEPDGIR
jgi:imidazolonepropionase-like amidohydrolase